MKPHTRGSSRLSILLLLLAAWSVTSAQQTGSTEREVTFQNGPVQLKGTMTTPTVNGRHPAVVFLHGSGPATRDGFRPYAETFARLGLASLRFDKRGSGSSGGSWTTSSLDDLAGDALAAIAFLKTQDDVDSGRIGFWGVSQAGWVATLAASQSRDVAFMVVISGGGVSPRESELFSYSRAFEKAGLSEEEKSKASGIIEMYFNYLATGEGRSLLVDRLNTIHEERLSPLVEQLNQILPSEENRANWSWVATWDPAPHVSKIQCPVLLLFGDRDADHPTAEAVRRWRDGLKTAGNDQATIVVFPGAGHGIRMREGHTGPGRPPFADGYTDVMIGWLWRHVLDRKE